MCDFDLTEAVEIARRFEDEFGRRLSEADALKVAEILAGASKATPIDPPEMTDA